MKTILAFLDDLFLLPRIEDVASEHGYRVRLVSKAEDMGITGRPVERSIPLTEPLDGPEAILMREVSAMRPGLILIDANLNRLPWAKWIQVMKTSAATRRIPILVFGPHVQGELLEKARAMGADVVVSRGAFHRRMGELILKHIRPAPIDSLLAACEGPLPEKARAGIRFHNDGAYYQAHELLEEAWMDAAEMEGYLYRALLQVSVTYLHLSRGNLRGARKMALRIHQWLDPLPDQCRGVDVADLKMGVTALREALLGDPPPSNLRPIKIQLVS